MQLNQHHPHPWRTRHSSIADHDRFQVVEELVEVPTQGERVYTYVRSTHDLVAVLVVTDTGNVLLRHAYHHPLHKTINTLLCDRVWEGEVPSQCARRVLATATGSHGHQLTPLGRMVLAPDDMLSVTHLFFAPVNELTTNHARTSVSDELITMDMNCVLQHTLRGDFDDGALQLAVLLAVQHHLV